MVNKRKVIILVLSIIMLLSIPGTALAGFDEYGYNAKARMFVGTLDNWEAFLQGVPAAPWDPLATDVVFVERKWDRLFDPMVSGNPPLAPGAWQQAHLWEFLSGDQLGSTWNLDLLIVYSPNTPIPGATEIPVENMGYTGFYFIINEEWILGPKGQKESLQKSLVKPDLIERAVKCSF